MFHLHISCILINFGFARNSDGRGKCRHTPRPAAVFTLETPGSIYMASHHINQIPISENRKSDVTFLLEGGDRKSHVGKKESSLPVNIKHLTVVAAIVL
jgi:hypothetical protein